MSQRVAIYARVSTLHNQNPEMQLTELREYASRRGWKVTVEGRPSMVLEATIATHGEDENDQGCLATAMHAVLEEHETPSSTLHMKPDGVGDGTTDHAFPFHCSTRVAL